VLFGNRKGKGMGHKVSGGEGVRAMSIGLRAVLTAYGGTYGRTAC